ncbi:MAG: extracellular solute-binding protein [Paracoccaceae bacterium]|uniref:extracellular solute-binding protein n=1 Tax=Seohaeicola saemankumensis TaxID=481181 RepID=UPI001E3CC050|nr:extracellular solute-binding protein [Seohaeicola saemankumensis]MCD1626909.1 extracellular solute-binding protein [Seohaeicola saemankumensis]
MECDYFRRYRRTATACALVFLALGAPVGADSATRHGIAMYGEPVLPPDFVSLPYANPDAPSGGRLVEGATGGFDSLNPFILKGTAPWQLRFLAYESLMARNWDEPFSLYALLAESVVVAEDRSWVEFTLRSEARFSDGSPVTVEDVIWSYETLGSQGHPRYLGFAAQTESITRTGPRSLRISFNTPDRELALIAGLRPILQKSQWEGRDFTASTINDIPIGSAPYTVSGFEQGRYVTLTRNPDYWGRDLPIRRGTNNLDEIRIEYFGDQSVMFEAFKAGEVTVWRETNAEDWQTRFGFDAVRRGDVILSEITHARPTGMTGFVMNSARPHLSDWRVREALLLAFNFTYINGTITGGRQPRITSYFSNSELGLREGPAEGRVRDLLEPFADSLPPGALEGYTLPEGDASERNRADLRRAAGLLQDAGWQVQDGRLVDRTGTPFTLDVLLRQGDRSNLAVIEIYRSALERLGITTRIRAVDNAQYAQAEAAQDFDMMPFRRDLSLSPGNEQRLYWGSEGAGTPGTRNVMSMQMQAADAMIEHLLNTDSRDEFIAATRALDRVLMAGRYVIPVWTTNVDRIAHAKQLKFPENTPIYGDRIGWMPDVWWFEEQAE